MMTGPSDKKVRIIIESLVESDNELLHNIVKTCLERDYAFRTLFAGAKVMIDTKVCDVEKEISNATISDQKTGDSKL